MFQRHFRFKKRNFKPVTKLGIIWLLVSLSFAALETVWPLYLYNLGFDESNVGFLSSFLIIIGIFSSILNSSFFEKKSPLMLLNLSLFFSFLILILIPFVKNIWIFILLAILLTIVNILRLNSFDLLFKEECSKEELSKDEGFLFSLINIGYFLGPLIAGYIMLKFNLNSVFYLSGFLILISLYLILLSKISLNDKINNNNIQNSIINNIKSFFKNKDLVLSYIMLLGTEIWWSLIYIYMPIFIFKKTGNYSDVGLFLSLVVIPLILFDFETGKLANKIKLKYLFFSGYFLLTIFALISFYFYYINFELYFILFILIIGSFAVSLIEPITLTFFYEIVKPNVEKRFLPIFETSRNLGGIIGRTLIASILIIFSDSFAFLVIGISMLLISLISFKIKF
jgi:MFS family permease